MHIVIMRQLSSEKNELTWQDTFRDAFCCPRRHARDERADDIEEAVPAEPQAVMVEAPA